MTPLAIVVLGWMMRLQPPAVTPWRDTYASTAEAIADVAEDGALYQGDRASVRAAAVLTSVAWYEGRFRVDAIGPHGACVCMMQVSAANLRAQGVTRGEAMADARACLRAAVRVMLESFAVCRASEPRDRLAHYAIGSCGDTEGRRASRYRLALADALVRRAPAD